MSILRLIKNYTNSIEEIHHLFGFKKIESEIIRDFTDCKWKIDLDDPPSVYCVDPDGNDIDWQIFDRKWSGKKDVSESIKEDPLGQYTAIVVWEHEHDNRLLIFDNSKRDKADDK